VTIEIQCTSCHTRYRIDEQVLPEGTPTFKCSRCGHVFTFEPRAAKRVEINPEATRAADAAKASERPKPPAGLDAELRTSRTGSGAVKRYSATGAEIESSTAELAIKRPPPRAPEPIMRSAPPPRPAPSPAPSPAAPIAPPPDDLRAPEPKPASAGPAASLQRRSQSAEDLLSRPLRPTFRIEDPDLGEGDNLAFDFRQPADEPGPFEHGPEADLHQPQAAQWEVGDPDAAAEPDPLSSRRSRAQRRGMRPSMPRFAAAGSRSAKRKDADREDEFPDEENSPVYNRGLTRSARFFVGLFAMVIVGYGLMTLLIRSSPATAADLLSRLPVVGDRFVRPITPARIVALRDVHSGYIHTKGGHTALVISGTAENVGLSPLHAIQIAVNLRDHSRHGLATGAVYCGNNLSPSMVSNMTPHELAFFQKLDPPKTFALEPSSDSPFVIVFIDPPAAVSDFDLTVASAVPADTSPPDNPGV